VRPEGLSQRKIPITPLEIEPASECIILILLGVGMMHVLHTIRNDIAHYKQQTHGRSGNTDCRTLTSNLRIEEGARGGPQESLDALEKR